MKDGSSRSIPRERAYLAGPTRSPDFPITPGTYDRSYNGEKDIFIMHLDIPAPAAIGSADDRPFPMLAQPNPFS